MLSQILENQSLKNAIIITKSKRKADELALLLTDKKLHVKAIHGNHRQEHKDTIIEEFTNSRLDIIITTDMILQSLNLEKVTTIISYDLPQEKKHYEKRLKLVDEIGESILLVNSEDEPLLVAMELAMKMELDDSEVENFSATKKPETTQAKKIKKKPRHKHAKTKNENA